MSDDEGKLFHSVLASVWYATLVFEATRKWVSAQCTQGSPDLSCLHCEPVRRLFSCC